MTSFAKDWPVLLAVGALAGFIIYVMIRSNKKDDRGEDSPGAKK